jgi:adenosylmethionine-8-amino-7-oxononanoate aminotransferase
VLFIADEVMTGWGRTGTLFACEQAGVSPDILCLAKGLTGGAIPLAATLASANIFESHRSEDRGRMFFHSSSFTANAIACAAANANIAIWREEDVTGRIARLGQALDEGLAALSSVAGLENPRRIGAIAAVDVAVRSETGYLSDVAPRLRAALLADGVLLRPLGNTIYVMPPYCMRAEEAAALFASIGRAVEELVA